MGIGSAKCCNMHKRQQDTQQAIRGSTTEHRRSSQMCLLGRGGLQECSDPSRFLLSGLFSSCWGNFSWLQCVCPCVCSARGISCVLQQNALMVRRTLVARIHQSSHWPHWCIGNLQSHPNTSCSLDFCYLNYPPFFSKFLLNFQLYAFFVQVLLNTNIIWITRFERWSSTFNVRQEHT